MSRLAIAAGDIKLAHSIFALPFAVLAGSMAIEPEASVGTITSMLALVVVCMVFARTWAMMINPPRRLEYDAKNPRTAARAIAGWPSRRARGAGSSRSSVPWRSGSAPRCSGSSSPTIGHAVLAHPRPRPGSPSTHSPSGSRRYATCSWVALWRPARSPRPLPVNPASLENPSIWWLSAMVLFWGRRVRCDICAARHRVRSRRRTQERTGEARGKRGRLGQQGPCTLRRWQR